VAAVLMFVIVRTSIDVVDGGNHLHYSASLEFGGLITVLYVVVLAVLSFVIRSGCGYARRSELGRCRRPGSPPGYRDYFVVVPVGRGDEHCGCDPPAPDPWPTQHQVGVRNELRGLAA
jgi:hypothetical protein